MPDFKNKYELIYFYIQMSVKICIYNISKYKMSINVEQINIMIDSNIPGKEPFKLTSGILYHPDLKRGKPTRLSELPYFTSDVRYPLKKLYYLGKQSYKKVLKFFFDKKYFELKLVGFAKNTPEEKSETTDQKNDVDSITKHNIRVMMELLFPTTFPSIRNFSSSFNEYIRGKMETDASFKGVTTTNRFSYIKVDGKVYTISKVTWLNDLLNHPVYKEFIDEFINYSAWALKETKTIEELLGKKKQKILERINDKSSKDTLYLQDDVKAFESNKADEKINNELKDPNFRDYEKKKFYENVDDIIKQFDEFFGLLNNGTPEIDKLYSKIIEINELYKRLTSNRSVTLKGISNKFTTNLSKITEELKKLNSLDKIRKNYITSGEVNIKLEGEEPEVVKELQTNYSRFIDFVEKIKKLLSPIKESSNLELQKTIIDYSENVKINDKLVFGELLKKIKEEFVFLKPKKFFSNTSNVALMYTGTTLIDKNKFNVPHYEIYLGIDLFEGEINESNLESVVCKYRGLYLGQETELFFSRYNPYDFSTHRVFVPEKTDELQKEDTKVPDLKEDAKKAPALKGGQYTKKNRRGNLRKTKKHI